jgi:hypothetical protein
MAGFFVLVLLEQSQAIKNIVQWKEGFASSCELIVRLVAWKNSRCSRSYYSATIALNHPIV